MSLFSLMRGREEIPVPLDYERAKEIAGIVKSLRHGKSVTRDSDGNIVTVFYPDSVVEDAARAATLAPDLATSADEIERVFTLAEQRVSSAIQTS